MKLLQALAKAEEYNCKIVNHKAGLKFSHTEVQDLTDLPTIGWELDDDNGPIIFQAEFVKTVPIHGMQNPATAFIFLGERNTLMTEGTKVKVTIEPL